MDSSNANSLQVTPFDLSYQSALTGSEMIYLDVTQTWKMSEILPQLEFWKVFWKVREI